MSETALKGKEYFALEDDRTGCSLTTMPLQKSVVYGPMDSRRFGKSLGINLLPKDQKVCSYACVYCQYEEPSRHEACDFPTLSEIRSETEAAFAEAKHAKRKLDWIMFSGNGEPTLHPDFLRAVETVVQMRNLYLPTVPLGILSNSTTCYLPDVQAALSKLNGKFMKLDAGNMRVFRAVNRPESTLLWGDVICGLYRLPGCVIQSMFISGRVDNTSPEAVDDWVRALDYIQPKSVQIYTAERATSLPGVLPVSRERLDAIASKLRLTTRIPAEVF